MGLFHNYSKVGPGVSKNEPEKKPFFRFFELLGRNFWKLVTANLWTFLLSIPLLTVGLAQVGLTYVTRTISRERQLFVTSDFFETIKKNWKQALAIGIIDLIVTIILLFDVYYFYLISTDTIGKVLFVLFCVLAVLFLFSTYYHYMLCLTFNFKIGQIYKNSFLLAMCGIKNNIIVTLALILLYAITLLIGYFTGTYGLILFTVLIIAVVPALRSYIINFTCFPVVLKFVIEPYYAEHPDDDIEMRQDLGLLPYNEPDEDVDWGE